MAKSAPINSLNRIIDGAQHSLKTFRTINETLREKVVSMSNRKHYTETFIAAEVAKLREAAKAETATYMQRFAPLSDFSSPVLEDGYWRTSAFLDRAAITHDPFLISGAEQSNTNAIMKALLSMQRQTNLLLSLPRMSTATLGKMAESAHSNGDWALLSQIYTECDYRGTTDDRARFLKAGIDSSVISEVTEGAELASRAKQLKSWIDYSLQSINEGSEDLGVKYEQYQALSDERRLVKEQNREQVRRAVEGAFTNGLDTKPAA
jgi:hypothetical protein